MSVAPVRPRCSKQSVEYVARAIAVGKQLAVGLFVYVDADLAEERDRFGDWKRPKDAPDDRRSPAPEIVFGDDGVGEVAARSAADEDLGARLPRAFEQRRRTGPDCVFARRSRLPGRRRPRRQSQPRRRGENPSGAEAYRGSAADAVFSSERAPHTVHRTTIVPPSSARPTICVRWLPHFGQVGGGFGSVRYGGSAWAAIESCHVQAPFHLDHSL